MTTTEVIDEIGTRLASAAPPRSRVLLFGSHARGTAAEDSDYDVLVIEPTVASPISEAVRLRRELRGLGVPIEIVVMDEAKARRRAAVPGTMVERALREGRLHRPLPPPPPQQPRLPHAARSRGHLATSRQPIKHRGLK
jgi:uncharacterized protein